MSERNKDEQVNINFGNVMRDARTKKGLSTTDVAKMVNITQSYYTMLEKGKRNISLELAVSLCRILDIDLVSFMKSQTMSNNLDFIN